MVHDLDSMSHELLYFNNYTGSTHVTTIHQKRAEERDVTLIDDRQLFKVVNNQSIRFDFHECFTRTIFGSSEVLAKQYEDDKIRVVYRATSGGIRLRIIQNLDCEEPKIQKNLNRSTDGSDPVLAKEGEEEGEGEEKVQEEATNELAFGKARAGSAQDLDYALPLDFNYNEEYFIQIGILVYRSTTLSGEVKFYDLKAGVELVDAMEPAKVYNRSTAVVFAGLKQEFYDSMIGVRIEYR